MTHSGGGESKIDLAALYIPVMPETSHLDQGMREAGTKARRVFDESFNAGGGADQMGNMFARKFAESFGKQLRSANLGHGIGASLGFIDKLGEEVDAKLASKLKNQLPSAYREAASGAKELREAQERLATATANLNDKMKTPTMESWVRVRREQIAAEKEIEAVTNKSAAAQQNYTSKLEMYNTASSKAHSSGALFAGMLGGAMVMGIQGVIGGFEHLISLGAHLFEDAVRGTVAMSEKLVEVGKGFEQLNAQTVEFSDATGPALDNLQAHVAKVFGQLDVSGKDLGKTYAQLGSVLGVGAGPELDNLARRVTDLQGRFSTLKAADLASIFHDYNVPVDQLNSSLATLVTVGQQSGQGLAAIVEGLKGESAEVLEHAGFSFTQAANAIGDIEKHGVAANQVTTVLQKTMALFAKQGMDFQTGLPELLKELSDPTKTDAQKDALAEVAFGTRKWADGLAMVQDLMRNLNTAFPNEPAQKTDEFIRATQTLDNKLAALKQHLIGMFAPFATSAVDAVEKGLNLVSKWFDTHHNKIIGNIKSWGDKFVDMIPQIKDWADIGVDLIEMVTKATAVAASTALELAAAFAYVSFDFDTGDKLRDASKKLFETDWDKIFNPLKDGMDKAFDTAIKNSDKIKKNFNDAADAAGRIGDRTSGSMGGSLSFPSPDIGSSGSGSSGSGSGGSPGGGVFGAPGAGPLAGKGAYTGTHADLWKRVAQAESSGNWHDANSGGFADPVYGGLQFKLATWGMFGGLEFADRADHASMDEQMIVADRTAFTGWQGVPPQGLGAWETITNGSVKGYGSGGDVGSAGLGGGAVPIIAHEGEYVWSKPAVAKFGPFIDWANAHHFDAGGQVNPAFKQVIWSDTESGQNLGEDTGKWVGTPGSADPGFYHRGHEDFPDHTGHVHTTVVADPFTGAPYNQVKAGSNIRQGQPGFPDWVYKLGAQYGVEASTYPTHQEWGGINHGIDWWPKGKANMQGAGYSHEDHVTLTSFAQAVGQSATGTPSPPGSAGSGTSGGSGVFGAGFGSGGGDGSISKRGTQGLPGQFGGYGAYDAETYDDMIAKQRAVTHAGDRIEDINKGIKDKQDEIDKANEELKKLNTGSMLTTDATKVKEKEIQIEKLKDELNKLKTRELPEAQQDLEMAQRKQAEASDKPPSKGGGDQYGFAKTFGGQFLEGITESLGLPSVSNFLPAIKPPWEFGAFKLGANILTWLTGGKLGKTGHTEGGSGGGGLGGSLFGDAGAGMTAGLGLPNLKLGGVSQFAAPGGKVSTGVSTVPAREPNGVLGGAPGQRGPGSDGSANLASYHGGDTWNIAVNAPHDLVRSVSNFSNSHDKAQQAAGPQSGAIQMV